MLRQVQPTFTPFRVLPRLFLVGSLIGGVGSPLLAQTPAVNGPAPPIAPAVVVRDDEGRVTVRAVQLTEAITLDGRLDESIYSEVPPIGDFIQQEPVEGQPATEKTDVWVFFDGRNVYVTARCWDSHPEREVYNEMRRDSVQIYENEAFGVGFDTFHDRRNGYIFTVNALGGLADAYVTDERDFNRDWNTVWDARATRFENGWIVEMAIPFKSLRYKAGEEQVWGVNFRRLVRWKNEHSYLTRIPASMGRRGMNKISAAATLVGIKAPPNRTNYELKPYAISDVTTDRTVVPPTSNQLGKNVGIDAKMGVTQGLTADFTVNTDFAQVEVDEQQVNLTRFNVFFPEKRDFFLEGQGIFAFGGVQNSPRNGLGPGATNNLNPSPIDLPNLFFSRQIGLTGGHRIDVDAGARVSGKAGPYSVGLLDIRSGDNPQFGIPPTNFGVARIKRDILRRSAIGALVTERSVTASGIGSNQLFGIDGVFSFFQNLNVNAYAAKTHTTGRARHDGSYRGQLDYNGERYGLQLEHMFLDENFNPEVGFVRRFAFRRDSAFVRRSVRPKLKTIRRLTGDATFDYITSPTGRLQSRYLEAAVRTEMQNGDQLTVELARNYEFLDEPFHVAEAFDIGVGGYSFPEVRMMYWLGPQRPTTGIVKVVRGNFYNGTRTEVGFMRGRVQITRMVAVEPGLTQDWVELPQGKFTTTLLTTRTTWTLTPRATVAALIQATSSTHALDANIRFQWEYQPGSFFYVVYTDGRSTRLPGFPTLLNSGLVVKFTRLFRL